MGLKTKAQYQERVISCFKELEPLSLNANTGPRTSGGYFYFELPNREQVQYYFDYYKDKVLCNILVATCVLVFHCRPPYSAREAKWLFDHGYETQEFPAWYMNRVEEFVAKIRPVCESAELLYFEEYPWMYHIEFPTKGRCDYWFEQMLNRLCIYSPDMKSINIVMSGRMDQVVGMPDYKLWMREHKPTSGM